MSKEKWVERCSEPFLITFTISNLLDSSTKPRGCDNLSHFQIDNMNLRYYHSHRVASVRLKEVNKSIEGRLFMNNKLPVLCSALALSILTALPSQAHELRRLGDGKGKFGEKFSVAFGLTGEPAREDEQNGIDFTSLFYQDG
jgi:hypothetical protein